MTVQKCPNGRYGKGCKTSCANRHCLGNSPCDHLTGECVVGCDRGYETPDCSTKSGYGDVSLHLTGTAPVVLSSLLLITWLASDLSPYAEPPCRAGTFGAGCKLNCSERHCDGDSTTCDAQSGTCRNGCKPGWKKPSCMEPCGTGLYGADCLSICTRRHCLTKAASCDHVTGSCGGKCEHTWRGEDCTGCDGKYGRDCSYSCSGRKCRDLSAPCHHVTGSCNGLCVSGWQGIACNVSVTVSTDVLCVPGVGGPMMIPAFLDVYWWDKLLYIRFLSVLNEF
ncbi:multiple epidermal growth factor-like domains protein 10 [Gigantopelta aegis]|uniref:multiple epidermal growth factor-like domains protein 10 n=1 Tax=Gigantopelta aegis TaxID=1735272 RepID=UPI001B88AEE0|nr:multiple epidermal growth factor-like domains protein 10 [Gigantopelta aegis]